MEKALKTLQIGQYIGRSALRRITIVLLALFVSTACAVNKQSYPPLLQTAAALLPTSTSIVSTATYVAPTSGVQVIMLPTQQNDTGATSTDTLATRAATTAVVPTTAEPVVSTPGVQTILLPTQQNTILATPIPSIPAAQTPVASSTLPVQGTTQPTAQGLAKGTQQPTLTGILAQGKLIYDKTAGGVGCQYCHGKDGRGKLGPNIRGKSTEAITTALGTVQQMQIVQLSSQEIQAVAAYLQYLASQP